jgi:hypothetical protein
MFKNSSSVILVYSFWCAGFANPAPAAAGGEPGPGCPRQPPTRPPRHLQVKKRIVVKTLAETQIKMSAIYSVRDI